MTRGHCGSLFLQCGGLAPRTPPPRRFRRRTLDAVLALAAIVVKREDPGSAARAVGDDEAQVGACSGVFGLVAGVTIAPLQLSLPRFSVTLKHAVGGDAEGLLEAKELAELIEQRQSETGVAAQLDLHARKSGLQASGVALKDQQGVIDVLAVAAMEEVVYELSLSGCSEWECWVLRKPSVHAPLEHPFFFLPAKSVNNLG
ncbi:MAG: hypothetical protein ACYDDI_11365 [Candidatus Acidiferrales bacterium]